MTLQRFTDAARRHFTNTVRHHADRVFDPLNHPWRVFLTMLVLAIAISPSSGYTQPIGLHLVDRVTTTIPTQTSPITQQRDIYIQDNRLAMRTPTGWFIIDAGANMAWTLDSQRNFISSAALDQMPDHSRPHKNTPSLQATGETQTIAGLTCHVYTARKGDASITACLAPLPELERFRTIFKPPPGTNGIPLFLTIAGTAPKGTVTFTQQALRIERIPIDPEIFLVPYIPRPKAR